MMKQNTVSFARPEEYKPGPGQYDEHLKDFGADDTRKMTLGGKYKWKPNDNPPPGLYEADKAADATRSKSPSTKFHKLLIPNKRDADPTPEPYDGHIKPFGADLGNKMTLGGKYDFKVNDVPPPGYYSPEKKGRTAPSTVIKGDNLDKGKYRTDARDQSPGPGDTNWVDMSWKIPGGPYISHADDFGDRQDALYEYQGVKPPRKQQSPQKRR